MNRQAKARCQHCGIKRHLKTLAIEHAGEVRKLEVCRPCAQAIKFARQQSEQQERVDAAA